MMFKMDSKFHSLFLRNLFLKVTDNISLSMRKYFILHHFLCAYNYFCIELYTSEKALQNDIKDFFSSIYISKICLSSVFNFIETVKEFMKWFYSFAKFSCNCLYISKALYGFLYLHLFPRFLIQKKFVLFENKII